MTGLFHDGTMETSPQCLLVLWHQWWNAFGAVHSFCACNKLLSGNNNITDLKAVFIKCIMQYVYRALLKAQISKLYGMKPCSFWFCLSDLSEVGSEIYPLWVTFLSDENLMIERRRWVAFTNFGSHNWGLEPGISMDGIINTWHIIHRPQPGALASLASLFNMLIDSLMFSFYFLS